MARRNDPHDQPRPDAARLAYNVVLVVVVTLSVLGYIVIRLLAWFASRA